MMLNYFVEYKGKISMSWKYDFLNNRTLSLKRNDKVTNLNLIEVAYDDD